MRELYTEVEIDASADRVWQVLTDFGQFPEWNPFIKKIEGKPESGSRLRIQFQPPGGREMKFTPKVLKVEPRKELRWLGRTFIPGLFDGQHTFKIEPLDSNRVRFIQREKFTGLLVPCFARMLDSQIKRGFKEMNQALKQRSEKK